MSTNTLTMARTWLTWFMLFMKGGEDQTRGLAVQGLMVRLGEEGAWALAERLYRAALRTYLACGSGMWGVRDTVLAELETTLLAEDYSGLLPRDRARILQDARRAFILVGLD